MPGLQRVAIVGAGAMGAMYAAHFADAGFDVLLVARGDRAARLRRGITVNGAPLPAAVVDAGAPGDVPPADLLIFAVKDAHLDAAIADADCVVGPDTAVLSVLNGLDSEERIAAALAGGTVADRVLLCVAAGMDAERAGADVRFRQVGRLLFGRARNDGPGDPDATVRAVQDALTRAGLAWETPPDMRRQLWWKFMVNVGINQASAVLRAPYGAFQHDGDARALMTALIDEVLAVSDAAGAGLGPDDVAAWHRVLANQPPAGWTSMAQDVAAGRSTEVEAFAGRVVGLGRAHGVPTPYNQAMLWILRSRS